MRFDAFPPEMNFSGSSRSLLDTRAGRGVQGSTMPQPAHVVDSHAMTHVGLVRQRNEDAVISDPERGIFMVADGMGGHPGGDHASGISVAEAHKALGTWAFMASDVEGHIKHVFQHVDRVVRRYGSDHPEVSGLGSTLVVAMTAGPKFVVAHVGDSRAYLLRGSSLKPLTSDHGRGNFLAQAIGMMNAGGPDVTEVQVRPGDYVMLCSDGLNKPLTDRQIERVMVNNRSGARDACSALIRATVMAGAPDNVTVLVIAFG